MSSDGPVTPSTAAVELEVLDDGSVAALAVMLVSQTSSGSHERQLMQGPLPVEPTGRQARDGLLAGLLQVREVRVRAQLIGPRLRSVNLGLEACHLRLAIGDLVAGSTRSVTPPSASSKNATIA